MTERKTKKIIEKYKKMGLDIIKGPIARIPLELYDVDGEFDHAAYRKTQEGLNKIKISKGLVHPKRFNEKHGLVRYIKKNISPLKFGICHGTRTGEEQESLSESIGIPVLGTEISSNAVEFPNTIQWDFHEIKEEWVDGVSFIYTNSLDHSYDPHRAIGNWMKCLHESGRIFLDVSEGLSFAPGGKLHNKYKKSSWWLQKRRDRPGVRAHMADCFRYSREAVEKIVENCISEVEGEYVIDLPGIPHQENRYLVIRRIS